MKRLLVLLAALLLVGCSPFDDRDTAVKIHWCAKVVGEEVYVNFGGIRGPVTSKVEGVTTNSKGCWYSVYITDDPRLQPRRFILHERHVR